MWPNLLMGVPCCSCISFSHNASSLISPFCFFKEELEPKDLSQTIWVQNHSRRSFFSSHFLALSHPHGTNSNFTRCVTWASYLNLFVTHLPFLKNDMPRAHLAFSLPQPWNQPFLQGVRLLWVEKGTRNQHIGTRYTHPCWIVTVSKSSQWIEPRNISTCIFISISIFIYWKPWVTLISSTQNQHHKICSSFLTFQLQCPSPTINNLALIVSIYFLFEQ